MRLPFAVASMAATLVSVSAAFAPLQVARSPQCPCRGSMLHMSTEDSAERITPPVALRCLSRQEVVDKLNGVPVFSVVNGADQMVATPEGAEEALTCCFYLEIQDAQAALEKLQKANPRALVKIATTPLGTAFALSEWPNRNGFDAATPSVGRGSPTDDADADSLDAKYDNFEIDDGDAADFEDESDRPALRLQAAAAEVESVRGLLKRSPVPPLLRRRNVLQGPIPLFGSDAIRFQLPVAEDDSACEEGSATTLTPLFFRRGDLLAAWAASGGTADSLPAVQVTDLRTVAWQMLYEREQDWRPMLFVAPEPAIDFVKEQQAELEAAAAAEAEQVSAAPAGVQLPNGVQLNKADVQGMIFGD